MLVLSGDADGNLGDRAILLATCEQLRRHDPQVHLTLTLRDGSLFRERFGADIVPRGMRGLGALLSAMRRSDLVLIGGGGLFQDDDSLVKMPYWALRALLARLLGGRVAGLALGVGPLDAAFSRICARLALGCMRPASVRDPAAFEVAQPLTRRSVQITPDPALLLPPDDAQATERWLREQGVPLDGRPLVGVAPRRWFPPRRRLVPHAIAQRWRKPASIEHTSRELIGLLARVLDQIVAAHEAHVLFMPSYPLAHEGDARVAEAVVEAMRFPHAHRLNIDDPGRYKAVAGRLAVMLGGRMHPCIFAAAMGTPVVGLGYNPKFVGFFELIGQADRVMDVRTFVRERRVDAVVRLIEEAIRDPDSHRPRTEGLEQRIRDYLQRVMEFEV